MAYRILAWFLRTVTRVFFRQVEVVGLENIPPGPVIFAGNHPNSLIDPILIITTCGRKVHFAAKDTLFKGRIMRAVLRGLGAVPLARKLEADGKLIPATLSMPSRDPAEMAKLNDAAFEAMFAVLATGGTIGIFPEGISHDESQLSKLKTGAARLALGGAKRSGPIAVVPCGLTFIHPKRFRSRVLVQYGTPLMIDPSEAADAVKRVTDDIGNALRRLTINAPDWETVRALDTVRRLYQPQEISIEDRVELARRFNTYYAALADHPKVFEIMQRVRAYQQKLDELGLTDRELARDLSKLEIVARMFRQIILIMWWLPLTVPAAPLHVPPLIFARIASSKLTPRKDVVATTKMLIGMGLVVLAYAATIGYVWWQLGMWWGITATIMLPLSGWATLRVLDRIRLVRRAFGTLARRFAFRREVRVLREERTELSKEVIRVVTEVKPKHLEALFPPNHPGRVIEEADDEREASDLDSVLDKRDRE